MQRRKFLLRIGAGLVALPAVTTLGACIGEEERPDPKSPGYGGGPAGGGGGGGPDAGGASESFVVQNADDSGHTHSFEVRCSHQEAEGWTYTATGGHTHEVWLSREDLARVFEGEAVTVETDDGHPHRWVIRMPASSCAS